MLVLGVAETSQETENMVRTSTDRRIPKEFNRRIGLSDEWHLVYARRKNVQNWPTWQTKSTSTKTAEWHRIAVPIARRRATRAAAPVRTKIVARRAWVTRNEKGEMWVIRSMLPNELLIPNFVSWLIIEDNLMIVLMIMAVSCSYTIDMGKGYFFHQNWAIL